MTDKMTEILTKVEMTYSELVAIGDEMIADIFSDINSMISSIGSDVNNLTTDEIRSKMWELQFTATRLIEIKEKSSLKAEAAEALQKERNATEFLGADGTAEAKRSKAFINCAEETLVQIITEYVSNQLKSKVDQLHRLVDCLKSILMSRMQEAKLTLNNVQ